MANNYTCHIGIPYEVACSLEDRLQKQLLLAIHKRLEKLKNIHESQTSSLVSDEGCDEMDSHWEERMEE